MPFVLMESSYEGEHNSSPVQIRRQAYWAILCGAAGQFLGNKPIWGFDPGLDRLPSTARDRAIWYTSARYLKHADGMI